MSHVAGASMPHHARDAELPNVGRGSLPHTWHAAVPLGLDSPMPYARLAQLPYVASGSMPHHARDAELPDLDRGSVPHTWHPAVPLAIDSSMPDTGDAELPYVADSSVHHAGNAKLSQHFHASMPHSRLTELPAWVTQQKA
jgi:hypothetical protein